MEGESNIDLVTVFQLSSKFLLASPGPHYTHLLLHLFIMVVVNTQPSTSAEAPTQHKNRRRVSKKPQSAAATKPISVDEDEDMTTDLTETIPVVDPAAAAAWNDDDAVMIDDEPMETLQDSTGPTFEALPASATKSGLKKSETRRVPIPPHRMTPLKKDWVNIFGPLTEILGLQVRMNVQRRSVEIRVSFGLLSSHGQGV